MRAVTSDHAEGLQHQVLSKDNDEGWGAQCCVKPLFCHHFLMSTMIRLDGPVRDDLSAGNHGVGFVVILIPSGI